MVQTLLQWFGTFGKGLDFGVEFVLLFGDGADDTVAFFVLESARAGAGFV
ncbi:hypothetical protein JZ785_21310 [Alicyclobacillus curvatus]|jgi:hypothetical protein|nr:hypothetical protein JZ785_21310 [Alicyclobacillus curvatus]